MTYAATADRRHVTPVERGGLSALVVIYVLAVVTPIFFTIGPLVIGTLRMVLLVAFVPLLIGLVTNRYGRFHAIDALLIAHALWSFLAIGVNNPDRAVQFMGATTLEFFGGYLVARACIRSSEDFVAVAKLLCTIVVLMLPFALYETLSGRSLPLEYLENLPFSYTLELIEMQERMGMDRAQVVFAHPIHFGLFCSIAFALAFTGLKGEIATPLRYITSGLVALSCLFALSSGALLAIALQLALIIYFAFTRNIPNRWTFLWLLFAVAYVIVDILSDRTPVKVFISYLSFSTHNAYWRLVIFEAGMANVMANPIFGIGMNNWVRPSWMHSPSVDNFWLLIAMRQGIPGFVFLITAILVGILQVARRDFSENSRLNQQRRAWIFTMAGLAFTLSTVHIWGAMMSFYFFAVGAGVWMTTAPAEAEESDVPRTVRALVRRDVARSTSAEGGVSASRYTRFSSGKSIETFDKTPQRTAAPRRRPTPYRR